MSLQPLPLSEQPSVNQPTWQEVTKLAEALWIQSSLNGLVNYLADALESMFSSQTQVWLNDSVTNQVRDENLSENTFLIDQPTERMAQAIQEKQVITGQRSDAGLTELPTLIALPLLTRDENLGAIQLMIKNEDGFRAGDIELLASVVAQFSISVSNLRKEKINQGLRRYISQLSSSDVISRSIFSNLDRDSLANSIASLLHQYYGFSRVNIYIARSKDRTVLNKIGISRDGLETEKIYYAEQDDRPVDWCVSHLQPLIINDAGKIDQFLPDVFDKYSQSELIIPLLQGDNFIGVLELCADQTNAFPPEAVQLLQLLAEKIAIAFRNANLYRYEQLKNLVAERLHDLTGSLSVDASLEDLFSRIIDELEVFFPWEAAAIWLIDTGSEELARDSSSSYRLAAIRCKDQSATRLFTQYLQNTAEDKELISNYPWLTEVVNTKIASARAKESMPEPLGALLGFESQYSALAAALVVNDQTSGIIECVHHQLGQYDDEAIAILGTFAKYAAISIENTRLYNIAHDQAWMTTVLLQVAEATQSITNLDELFETVVNIFPGLTGVEACAIYLWDSSIEALFYTASNGFDAEQVARLGEWDISMGSVKAFEHMKESRSPVILNTDAITDEIAETVFPNYDLHKDLLILFPMSTQNYLRGAILVDLSNSDLDLNASQEVWDEKYALIQGAAHQAAIAIENLQLVKSQEEEAYISVALLQVAQAVVSLSQLDEILGTIVRITPILVGVKRCIIYLWDGRELVFRQSQYFGFSKNDLAGMGEVIKANEFPFMETIQQTDHIIMHPLDPEDTPPSWNDIEPGDYHVVDGINPNSDKEISINWDEESFASRKHLLIGFPLSVVGEILGIMLVEEEEPVRGLPSVHIREKRIEIVKGITQQAAIAIKNDLLHQEAVKSERMERELQLAREIQATFLPDKLPEIEGWDIDVRWKPAREVGGDFYDILQLGEDKIGFVIADVADKGMPAALFMTLIRTLIRAAAKDKSSPAAVLNQVNELLIPDSKRGMFVTVFYGVFYLDTGTIIYANAGHNPPIIKRLKNDELVELTRTSMALGIFANIEIEEHEVSLSPGEWILFYTDGVTEAFSLHEELFGKERLIDLISEKEFTSSKDMLDLIETAVSEFIQGTDLSDDMTVAAIRRKLQ